MKYTISRIDWQGAADANFFVQTVCLSLGCFCMPPTLFLRRNDNTRTRLGVGIGLMMAQRYAQKAAHIGKFGRAYVPLRTRQRHRAYERLRGCRHRIGRAACAQHALIERSIVRGKKINVRQRFRKP